VNAPAPDVVDYDGRILAQADPGEGEKVVVAPIDLRTLRSERKRRRGHDTRAHLRVEAHTYMREQALAPADQHPITGESLSSRIRAAKEAIGSRDLTRCAGADSDS
jgi:hypothetical protein